MEAAYSAESAIHVAARDRLHLLITDVVVVQPGSISRISNATSKADGRIATQALWASQSRSKLAAAGLRRCPVEFKKYSDDPAQPDLAGSLRSFRDWCSQKALGRVLN